MTYSIKMTSMIIIRLCTIAILAFIIYKSLQPEPDSWLHPPNDKIAHALTYAVLTGFVIMSLPHVRLVIIVLTLMMLGLGIEYAQGRLDYGRTASWADAVANGVGISLIAGGWFILRPKPL